MKYTIEQAWQHGIAAHRRGQLQYAAAVYRGILQIQPAHAFANYNLGRIAVSANRAEEALPLFKKAIEADPKEDSFWLSYIDALIKGNNFDNATNILERAKKQGVGKDRLSYLEAELASIRKEKNNNRCSPSKQQISNLLEHLQNGNLSEAEALAIYFTQEFPEHQFGWKSLSIVYGQTGRTSESLVPSEKSVQLAPKDAESHSNLGIILKQLGRLNEAAASFNKAIALKPDHARAYFNLGNTLKELGRLNEAEVSLKQAIAYNRNYAEAHNNLGVTIQVLGRFDEAETCFSRAIALNPNFADAHNNLGITLSELGKLNEAEVSFRQAITLKPEFAEAHSNLGIVLEELGMLDEAENNHRQAIAWKPHYASAYYNLGSTLTKLCKFDEAKESYNQAIAIKPVYPEAEHMLAALTGEETVTAPRSYVEGLFEKYAAKFETSLIDILDYKIPKVIAEIIIEDNKSSSLGSVIDLGCGTGLFGREIRKFCENLQGIDLSGRMLEKAQDKNIYNKLTLQDIVIYLAHESLNFDYFVATDVFIYIGDLSDVFRLIKSRNKKSGTFAFSTEHYAGDGFHLEKSGRYSHSKSYIENLCKKFGYELRNFEIQPLRKENDQYISGGLYLLGF